MKNWHQLMTAIVLGIVGTVYCANAQDTTTTTTTTTTDQLDTNQLAVAPNYPLYRAQELSLDLFGSGSINRQTIDHLSGDRVTHNGRLGAGGGLNYFFCRYIGIGGDAYTENTAHDFIDSASGNLIGRLPIGETGIAPYIFGGGGYQFDEVALKFGQFGSGVEFRFCQHAGLFVDCRLVVPNKTNNYGVGRAGLRFSF